MTPRVALEEPAGLHQLLGDCMVLPLAWPDSWKLLDLVPATRLRQLQNGSLEAPLPNATPQTNGGPSAENNDEVPLASLDLLITKLLLCLGTGRANSNRDHPPNEEGGGGQVH